MIQYSISADDLDTRITDQSKNWFSRARSALDNLPDVPKSSDFAGLWSEVKDVYINLQHSKCAFCEKPLDKSHRARRGALQAQN